MNIKWKDVFLYKGLIILYATKNGEIRRVALEGLALQLLKKHAKVRRLDTDLLFPGNSSGKPINLRHAFDAALKVAGVDGFRWHDLRHSCASELAMNGATPNEIAEVLGHKSLEMVKRYAHLGDAHVSSVVASMNAKVFG